MDYGSVSGLTLNLNKTEGMWIGSLANCKENVGNIKFLTKVTYLGIIIGTEYQPTLILNWENKLETYQRILDNWSSKNLTLYTKITFLKTFALSKLTLLSQMLPIPDGYIQKIEKLTYNFIWGKEDKI